MESNRINATNNASASFLMEKKAKPEPNAPQFMQHLAEAVESTRSKTIQSEPATLARLVKPRSPIELTSRNPVQTSYIPAPASLEKVGQSRIVPFVVGG
jgi:hypothetical protein